MNTLGYVNVTLDIYCTLISLVLLVFMVTTEYRREKLNRIFIFILCSNAFVMLLSLGICLVEGKQGMPVHVYMWVAYFLTFVIDPFLLIAFTYYTITYLARKSTFPRLASYAAYSVVALTALDFVFIIITMFNGMCFYIDDNNLWCAGSFYWITIFLASASIMLNAVIIVLCRKSLEKREIIILSSYIVLPIVSVVLLIIFVGFAVKNFSIMLAILIFYAGIQSELSKQLKQKELELLESRIDIMLSQIQPHFLYNTLNAIENLCRKDGQQAAMLVNKFSSYLRDNMDSLTQKELVSFDRELEHMKVYLEIEKMRFKERLNVVLDLEATDFSLPILSVQPLVENAVRHGITKKLAGGTVTVSTRSKPEWIQITVADDGVGFEPNTDATTVDEHSHVGIENVKNRLAIQCDGTLTIESVIGAGTTATIIIPGKGCENK